MASLQRRGQSYACVFCWHGRRRWFTIGRVTDQEARAKASQVEYLLMRLKQRLVELPPGVDIVEFVQHDGRPPAGAPEPTGSSRALTLADLRDRYLSTHRGSLEDRTVDGIELHFRHLCRVIGEGFPIRELKLADLQGYVVRRARAKGIAGKKLSPATIRKEIVSLRTAWNWGVRMGLVTGRFAYEGLRYPKADEKPPFQTPEEIRRQIATGGLKPAQIKELWEALYLQAPEVAGLLATRQGECEPPVGLSADRHGRAHRGQEERADPDEDRGRGPRGRHGHHQRTEAGQGPAIDPQGAVDGAAAGGAARMAGGPSGRHRVCSATRRRSGGSKKRSRTTGNQAGGQRATTLRGRLETVRAASESPSPGPLTPDECHDHFRRTLRGSEWQVVRGLHVLRHSFISCLAAAGVDQRIIDDIVGHTSEEMRRRYRHLTPQVKSQAVAAVFG